MEQDRIEICRIISEMLDHGYSNGMYQTTKAYDQLEQYIEKVREDSKNEAKNLYQKK